VAVLNHEVNFGSSGLKVVTRALTRLSPSKPRPSHLALNIYRNMLR